MSDPSKEPLTPALVAGALDFLPGGGIFGVFGERGTKLVVAEWQRNRSSALRMARERAGLSREDLDELIVERPEVVPLLIRTLHAAGMTGQDKPLRLLAGFLGDALADVAKIDEAETLISAVANLTEHHIKVLEILGSLPADYEALKDHARDGHWTTGLVLGVSSMRPELTLVGVQGLLAAGFVSDAGLDGGGVTWDDIESGGTILAITELGRTVLEILVEIGTDDRT